MTTEGSTRDRILGLVVSTGPVAAGGLADRLGLTPAGVRRHLGTLSNLGFIEEHKVPRCGVRGRGRPARCFVATREGQKALKGSYEAVAAGSLGYLRRMGSLSDYIEEESVRLEKALREAIDPDAPLVDRAASLAEALSDRGYAATVRPLPGGVALQLCQGHCPVLEVVQAIPEWCEAETRVLSRVLGVHVQRLSTLAGGAHVCTTNIPMTAVKAG